jgi:hypothetical protein
MQWPRTGKSSVKHLGYTVSLSGMPRVKCQGCAMSSASDFQNSMSGYCCIHYPFLGSSFTVRVAQRIPPIMSTSLHNCTISSVKDVHGIVQCEVYNVQCPLSGISVSNVRDMQCSL